MRSRPAAVASFAVIVILLAGCNRKAVKEAALLTGGDPRRGQAAIVRFGCGSCHAISGISSAHGLVGPPLTGIRDRMYVAGMLENSPANIERWIRDPKSLNPRTAMPTLGVSEKDAADIAAYLYSIK